MITVLSENGVVFNYDNYNYCNELPYHQSEMYQKYLFNEVSKTENQVYRSVRILFRNLGFDNENYNTKNRKPLHKKNIKKNCTG